MNILPFALALTLAASAQPNRMQGVAAGGGSVADLGARAGREASSARRRPEGAVRPL